MSQTAVATLPSQQAERNDIRPFRVNVPESDLTELRRRILASMFSGTPNRNA